MKITKEGITFTYNDDDFTWIWWWERTYSYKFRSAIYGLHFSSLKSYWMHVGRQNDHPMIKHKIEGFNYQSLIETWVKRYFSTGCYLVLDNVNLDAKPASFWRTVPEDLRIQFNEDVIVLKCKDYSELKSLCESIELNFANASGFSDGDLVSYNFK
jgi:hypothetical protein